MSRQPKRPRASDYPPEVPLVWCVFHASGVPARAIQDVMGHASIAMTERYMHLAPAAHADILAALQRGTGMARPSGSGANRDVTVE